MPEQSLEGLSLHLKCQLLIEPVLWMYFVNFPMLFHPVDIHKKFGFQYPVGLFIDDQGAETIKQSIPMDDYIQFSEYSKKSDSYVSNMDFYHSQQDLSDEEILATWDEEKNGKLDSQIYGHCMQMHKCEL